MLNEGDQTNRVDVEDSGGVWIGAHLGWVARDREDVAKPEGVGTEQVHLHAEQVCGPAHVPPPVELLLIEERARVIAGDGAGVLASEIEGFSYSGGENVKGLLLNLLGRLEVVV